MSSTVLYMSMSLDRFIAGPNESPEELAASRAEGADLPGIAAFFATLGDLVGDEQGTLAE